MQTLIDSIRNGHIAKATKEFRATFDCDLKTAREAITAIRERGIVGTAQNSQYVVVSRWGKGREDEEVVFDQFSSKGEAMSLASELTGYDCCDEFLVARIIAASADVRIVKDVA